VRAVFIKLKVKTERTNSRKSRYKRIIRRIWTNYVLLLQRTRGTTAFGSCFTSIYFKKFPDF